MRTDDARTQPVVMSGPTYSLGQLVRHALKLGMIGFGGSVTLIAYMHRNLVEREKWISEPVCEEGLTLGQLLPGRLAAQLASYLGYVYYGHHRTLNRSALLSLT